MAKVDATGVTPTTLDGYIKQLEGAFKDALGQDLNLAPESPQGQLIGILGLALARADEALVSMAGGLSLNTAKGQQLDAIGSIMNISRITSERSQVTATLTGTNGTSIPKGSQARTTAGEVFETDEAKIIPSSGTIDVTMFSVEHGPIPALANSLTQIVDVISGWTAVNNASAAELGRLIESDREYRQRYSMELAANAHASLEAIRTAVLQAEGVSAALVYDNDTGSSVTVRGVAIAAHSFITIVKGGADADVAQAILDNKTAGIGTVGSTTITVTHPQGHTLDIKFQRLVDIPLTVAITIDTGAGFPSDGILQVRERVEDWAAGTLEIVPGQFDPSGLSIGESLDLRRLLTPVNSVPGHTITDVRVLRLGDDSQTAWAVSTAYVVDDIVYSNGGTYRCITAHTSAAADEPETGASWTTNWVRWPYLNTWAGGVAYIVGDLVSSGSLNYICTTAHTSAAATPPPDSSANWNQWPDLDERLTIDYDNVLVTVT